MNYSELVFTSIVAGFIALLSLPSYMAEQEHDHRPHTIHLNHAKASTITVCISEGDTVAQVAFPHTNMKKHIDYD